MYKLLLLSAVLALAAAMPAKDVSLLKRLLAVLEEDTRSLSWFKYDANSKTLYVTYFSCVPSATERCDEKAVGHSLQLTDSKGKKMGAVTESYKGQFREPYSSYNMDFLKAGEKYQFAACVIYSDGQKKNCNIAKFTAGTSTEYGNKPNEIRI